MKISDFVAKGISLINDMGEKYDCGGISEKEWKKIKNMYSIYIKQQQVKEKQYDTK